MPDYIDFRIAPYCLAQLLLALHQQKIYHFSITQEDNDLHVRISEEELERAVYGHKDISMVSESLTENHVED